MLAALLLAASLAHGGLLDYRLVDEDLGVMAQGLEAASRLESELFPDGIGGFDAVLHDSQDVYVFSRSTGYELPKLRRIGEFQVYVLKGEAKPLENEMHGCAAGRRWLADRVTLTMAARYFACGPWRSWQRHHEKRGTLWRHRESYLGTIFHELGHLYAGRRDSEPTPEMKRLRALIDEMILDRGVSREQVFSEGYAALSELKASRKLYPAHFARLKASAKSDQRGDAHAVGLRAAVELLSETR